MKAFFLADVLSVFAWDWASFWTELAAGAVTFGLGAYVAYRLLKHELAERDSDELEEFRNLASEVCADFEVMLVRLEEWLDLAPRRLPLPVDAFKPTWDLDQSRLRLIFARRGIQRPTQAAMTWFVNTQELAKKWNGELRGRLSADTERQVMLAIPGALEKVRAAVGEIKAAANLE